MLPKLHEPLTTRNATTSSRDLTTRSITVRASTVDESARTVEAVISTEVVAQVYDWARDEVIDEVLIVSGAEFDMQCPLLANHNRFDLEAVHGAVRNMHVEGAELLGRLHFDDDVRSLGAFRKVSRGFITDVSAGYRVTEHVDLQPGESREINGITYKAEKRVLRLSTKWKIREVSLVPIGADPNAKIREQPNGPTERTSAMNPRLRAYLISLGMRSDATDAQALEYLNGLKGSQRAHADAVRANPDHFADNGIDRIDGGGSQDQPEGKRGEPGTTDNGQANNGQRSDSSSQPQASAGERQLNGNVTSQDPEAVRQAERDRIRQINALANRSTPAELISRCVNEGLSVEASALAIMTHERGLREQDGGANPSVPAVHTNSPQGQDRVRDLSAGLSLRCGFGFESLVPNARGLDQDTRRERAAQLAERGERFSDLSLVDICREALVIEGRVVPHRRDEMIRAAVSTATLQQVFTDSVNAAVTMGYDTAPDSSREWTEETDVSDFKVNTDITLGKSSGMKRLARGGVANHASIDDEAETYRIARYAEQFVIDEQDIIDDMFSVLQDMPGEMQEEAAQLRPDLVYSILLANPTLGDGTALFHSDHANLTTAALGAAGLQAALTAMAKQTRGNRQLNLRAQYLIGPQDLRFTGMQLLNSAEIREAAAANGTSNVIAMENLKLVSENRLGAAGVTDPATGTAYTGSATNYFLAAARRTIRVAYRAGTNRRPTVRRFVLDRGQWGVGWDINLDIGAYARDHRGLHKSTGAG